MVLLKTIEAVQVQFTVYAKLPPFMVQNLVEVHRFNYLIERWTFLSCSNDGMVLQCHRFSFLIEWWTSLLCPTTGARTPEGLCHVCGDPGRFSAR